MTFKNTVLVLGARAQQGKHRLHLIDRLKRQGLQIHMIGFYLGKIQKIIDNIQQGLAGGMDLFHIVPLLRTEICIEHQMGHAHNTVHGRTYFVAHVGKKDAFGRIGRLGAFLGLAQHAFMLALLRHIVHIPGDAGFILCAHHFVGHHKPAQAAPRVAHAQFHMLLEAQGPAFGPAEIAPAMAVFGQDAFFHGHEPFRGVRAFTQAKLLVKNLVARKFRPAVFTAQFEHAEPTQAARQRKS